MIAWIEKVVRRLGDPTDCPPTYAVRTLAVDSDGVPVAAAGSSSDLPGESSYQAVAVTSEVTLVAAPGANLQSIVWVEITPDNPDTDDISVDLWDGGKATGTQVYHITIKSPLVGVSRPFPIVVSTNSSLTADVAITAGGPVHISVSWLEKATA